MILSTGSAKLEDIRSAIKAIRAKGNKKIIVLQCTSNYPVEYKNINLSKIRSYKKEFKCDVGFSDHSIGYEAAFLSVAAGGTFIEKHFTLNNKRKGFDHKISLEPIQFKEMVYKIRLAEKIMGSKNLKLEKNVAKVRNALRRIIVAKKNIKKGVELSEKNLAIKRGLNTKNSLAPIMIYKIIGKKLLKSIKKDSSITYNHFKNEF